MDVATIGLSQRERKRNGIHYTPARLGRFLAARLLRTAGKGESLSVLDPACGDGELLLAIADEARRLGLPTPRLTGVDRDPQAVDAARVRLEEMGLSAAGIILGDFLDQPPTSFSPLGMETTSAHRGFDAVISNPPYVRVQTIGGNRSKELAEQFGLAGRVDLYHAFTLAMANALRPGGILGLLCSNRFLTTQGGRSMREFLADQFDLNEIWDLGDTKLFDAAVLPAIVIGEKSREKGEPCRFTRIYQDSKYEASRPEIEILDALEDGHVGAIRASSGDFTIERGELGQADGDSGWTLHSAETRNWLAAVRRATKQELRDLGKIRVGIKTTADKVFIRSDWSGTGLDESERNSLLRPLLTHHVAAAWRQQNVSEVRQVLYTHEMRDGRRTAIDLESHPRAKEYLQSHREQLESRSYVKKANRQWFEIWVPQQPDRWVKDKLVWPDISEKPRFFIDRSGAVVNGDCYWLTVDHLSEAEQSLVLAVANSSFAVQFYDRTAGNRLYSGRRRFITQYLERLPIPKADGATIQEVHELVRSLEAGPTEPDVEKRLDSLVWELFGFGS